MTHLKRLLTTLVALSAASFTASTVATEARAADPPCDPDTLLCYVESPVTISKNLSNVTFDNALNTHWLGCGNGTESCDQEPAGDCTISACIEAKMSDSKIGVSMPGQFEVSWPTPGKLRIVPKPHPVQKGKLDVKYKLAPMLGVFVNVLGYKGVFNIDPLDLIKVITGNDSPVNAEFSYEASASCPFNPWAFSPPAECKVADGLQDGEPLIQIDNVEQFIGGADASNYINLAVSIDVGTDTTFSWKTEQLIVDGADAPWDGTAPYIEIPYNGGSSVQVGVKAKGTLGYKGVTQLYPTMHVTEVAGISVNLNLPIDVGADVPFEGSLPLELQKAKFTVPLPDLFVPTTDIDFGTVEVGQKATKIVKLSNTGLMKVRANPTSSVPEFTTDSPELEIPEAEVDAQTFELKVNFIPKKEGTFDGVVDVVSNDPDQPKQSFKVKGKGKVTAPEPEPMTGGMGGEGGMAGMGGGGGMPPEMPKGGMGGMAPAGMAGMMAVEAGGAAGKGGAKQVTFRNNDTATDATSSNEGGCGCAVVGAKTSAHGVLLLGLAGLIAARRRRRAG